MGAQLVNVLVVITCIILIALLLGAYWMSMRGEQRVITAVKQGLLPILSAVVATASLLFTNGYSSAACTDMLNTLRYVGLVLVILLILLGLIRYFLARPERDQRLLVQPILLAAVVITLVFLIEFLNGCLW